MIQSHRSLLTWAVALLLTHLGLWEARTFPSKPWMACLNWLLAITLVSGDMIWLPLNRGVPALSLRPILGTVICSTGLALVTKYYLEHRSS